MLKGDEWVRRNQTEWLYSNGLCTLQRMNRWNNNNWETFYHIIYEYSNGNLIKVTHQNVVNGNTILITTDRQKTRFVGFKFYMIEFQFLIKQIFSF